MFLNLLFCHNFNFNAANFLITCYSIFCSRFNSVMHRLFIFCCSMNGVLEFVDTADMTVMMQAEHFMATDVEWDPTGRYVATSVSWWGHKVDNAYWLWNFQGKLLYKQPLDRFCQLQWRPRPLSLLSDDHLKVLCHTAVHHFGLSSLM